MMLKLLDRANKTTINILKTQQLTCATGRSVAAALSSSAETDHDDE